MWGQCDWTEEPFHWPQGHRRGRKPELADSLFTLQWPCRGKAGGTQGQAFSRGAAPGWPGGAGRRQGPAAAG